MITRPLLEGLESRDLPSAVFVGPVAIVAQTIPANLAIPSPAKLLKQAISALAERQQLAVQRAQQDATADEAAEQRVLADPLATLAQKIMARSLARQSYWYASALKQGYDELNDLDHEPSWRIIEKTNELVAQWSVESSYATLRETYWHERFHAVRYDPTVDVAEKTRLFLNIFGWRGEGAGIADNLRGLTHAAQQAALQGVQP